jgi:hypothetical protein
MVLSGVSPFRGDAWLPRGGSRLVAKPLLTMPGQVAITIGIAGLALEQA